MTEAIEPRQGAFFPVEDNSITMGRVEVLSDGTENVGRVRRWQELVEGADLELTRLEELIKRWDGVTGAEINDSLESLKLNFDLIGEYLDLPKK